MVGLRAKVQAAAEGLDLLPLTARDVDVQAVCGGGQAGVGQLAQGAELLGLPGKVWKRCGHALRVEVGFGIAQAALAQVGGQCGVFGFPVQAQGGEGPGFPQLLVLGQELVECQEAFA
ncbi:hypothetical protein D3C81_1925660 [compost metagenome]